MPEMPVPKEINTNLVDQIATTKYVLAGDPQSSCQKQSGDEPGASPVAELAAVERLSEEWVAGHRLRLQLESRWTRHRCDHCGNFILGLIHTWHACRDCSYKVHARCALSQPLLRRCAHRRVCEDPAFILQICRERGLAAQRFKCAECAIYVLPAEASWRSRGALYDVASAVRRPRLCDYTGDYYCTVCCCDRTAVIPARVVHNWDFGAYTVSQAALQFLELMYDEPVLDISSLHPGLFTMVEELGHVRELRRQLHHMEAYLRLCPDPTACSHRRLVRGRLHLVTQPQLYSLRDLTEVEDGLLVPLLERLLQNAWFHFSVCPLCARIGNYCVICRSRACWLMPFQQGVSACGRCKRLLHTACRPLPHSGLCPRCDSAEASRRQGPAGAASEKGDDTTGSGSATAGGAVRGAGRGTAGDSGERGVTAGGPGPSVGRGVMNRTATLGNDTVGGKEKLGNGSGSLCGQQLGTVAGANESARESGGETHSESGPAPDLGIDTWEDVYIRSFRAILEIEGRLLTSGGLTEMVFSTSGADGTQLSEMTFPFSGMYIPVDGALYQALSAHLPRRTEAGPLAPLDQLVLARKPRKLGLVKQKAVLGIKGKGGNAPRVFRAGPRPVLPEDCVTAVVFSHTGIRAFGQKLGRFGENPSGGCKGNRPEERSHAKDSSVRENGNQRNTRQQLVIEDASSFFRRNTQRVRNVTQISKAEMVAAPKNGCHVSVQDSVSEVPPNQNKAEIKYKPNGLTHSRGPNGCGESTQSAPAPSTSKAGSCQPWADDAARANRERLEFLFRQRRMASLARTGANGKASVNKGGGKEGAGVGQLSWGSPDGAASDSGDDNSSEASVSTVVTVRVARQSTSPRSPADWGSPGTKEAAPAAGVSVGDTASSAGADDRKGSFFSSSGCPVPPCRSPAGGGSRRQQSDVSASEPRGQNLFQVFAEGFHRAYNPTAEDVRNFSVTPPRSGSGESCGEGDDCPAQGQQRERGLRLLPAGSGRIGHRPVGWDPRAECQGMLASL